MRVYKKELGSYLESSIWVWMLPPSGGFFSVVLENSPLIGEPVGVHTISVDDIMVKLRM